MSPIPFTKKDFDDIKSKAEDSYKKYGEVHCPFLGKKVIFNAKGLDHIKMKSWNHARNERDQWTRLKLLYLVPGIIKKSHTLQGIEQGSKFERIKIHSRWDTKMVYVRYYEFIAIENEFRIKIIVKQLGEAQPYFWSIIPFWKQTDSRTKKMFEGNPEED